MDFHISAVNQIPQPQEGDAHIIRQRSRKIQDFSAEISIFLQGADVDIGPHLSLFANQHRPPAHGQLKAASTGGAQTEAIQRVLQADIPASLFLLDIPL